MVEKTGALQGHAPEMVGDAPLMRKGLAADRIGMCGQRSRHQDRPYAIDVCSINP